MTLQLPSPILAIASFGAVTNIGTDAAQTLSSWISQVRATRRVTLDGHADPFTIADIPDITSGLSYTDRLFRLAASALAEAFDGSLPPSVDEGCLNILILPAAIPVAERKAFEARIDSLWPESKTQFRILAGGSTAGWHALEIAYQALVTDRDLNQVTLLAVDSLCDPQVLAQAADKNWLLQSGNSEGYVPGEAAACIVLQRASNATSVPSGRFIIHRPASSTSAERLWPDNPSPSGEHLTSALTAALERSGMGPEHIGLLVSDMDGSSWRAKVEQSALGRAFFSKAPACQHWRPSTLLGQVGTTSGLIAWLLPMLINKQRVQQVNSALTWSLDPAGPAAACVIERAPN